MAEPTPDTSAIEILIRRSTQRQWLTAMRLLDMTREELTNDDGAQAVFLCFLDGDKPFDYWLDAPLDEVTAVMERLAPEAIAEAEAAQSE